MKRLKQGYSKICLRHRVRLIILILAKLILKMGQPRPLFFIFGLFNQTIKILQQINVKKCPNVHPVFGTKIRTHDLSNMSRHPHQPLDQGSHLIY